MSNRLAFALAAVLALAAVADLLLNGGAALLFLMRRFVTLVDYLAFWR